jgi:hypothetical protein
LGQDRCDNGWYCNKCIWCPAGIVEILCEGNQQSLVDDQNIWRADNILSPMGACELGYQICFELRIVGSEYIVIFENRVARFEERVEAVKSTLTSNRFYPVQ